MKLPRFLKRAVLWMCLIGFGLALASSSYGLWFMAKWSRRTTTAVRMRDLMGVLRTERPADPLNLDIAALVGRYNRSECAADAWGRPFIIEISGTESGGTKYRITSLGSDGLRGPCCRLMVEDPREDAVLDGNEWLQVWVRSHRKQAE